MKKTFLISILILLLTGFHASAQDISGSWSWRSVDGGDMFVLELIRVSKDNFRGSHCSVYLQGDRVDCYDVQDDFTVVLIRKAENIFEGSIRSGYSYSTGNVQLQYLQEEDRILFTLINPPEGEFYIPFEAELQRN